MNKQVTIYDALGKHMPRVVEQLPDWVDPERFRRTVFWLMQSNPALEKMQPKSIVDGCMKAAMDGLLLDGKEAALIPHQGVARYSPMIGGLMKLARRSKQFRAIHVHPVYENDHIEAALGDEPRINHRPLFFGNRGALIGAYCIVEMEGGWREYEVMSAADIAKVRKASPSSNSPAWRDWEDQMACKAVFRRLWKRLSHDVEQLSTAIDRETEGYIEEPPVKDVTPKADTKPAGDDALAIPPHLDRRQKQPEPGPEPDNAGTISPGVAEMLEAIGEPNADRDSWDQWLVKDVMPLIGDDIGPNRADDFIAALQHTMTTNGLGNWGAPIFDDWRQAIRDCFTSEEYQ